MGNTTQCFAGSRHAVVGGCGQRHLDAQKQKLLNERGVFNASLIYRIEKALAYPSTKAMAFSSWAVGKANRATNIWPWWALTAYAKEESKWWRRIEAEKTQRERLLALVCDLNLWWRITKTTATATTKRTIAFRLMQSTATRRKILFLALRTRVERWSLGDTVPH